MLLAALFFTGIHLGIAGTAIRDRAIGILGKNGYLAAFAVASVIGLAWLVAAHNRAPYLVTWGMLEWWKPIAIILMLPAALVVVIGLTTPNPTSVAQEGRIGQAPQGIVRVTRHPFLTGVGLWALVHLIGNGDIASLVFFATWAVVALAGTVSIGGSVGGFWAPRGSHLRRRPPLCRSQPLLPGATALSRVRLGSGAGASPSSSMRWCWAATHPSSASLHFPRRLCHAISMPAAALFAWLSWPIRGWRRRRSGSIRSSDRF